MQHLEVSCAVRRLFKSLGFKGLRGNKTECMYNVTLRHICATIIAVEEQ